MKKKCYSIGEIAKLTNLSIQTLRYYDQIDLFKPSYVDPDTNYRYYSDSQLYYLDLIKSLKSIGTPLETIKNAQNFTIEELVEFLEAQEDVVNRRIQRLQDVQYALYKTKKQLKEQLAITVYNEVYETYEDSSRLLKISMENVQAENIPDTYFSSLITTIENEGSIIISRYGYTFPFKKYKSMNDISFNSIFTPLLTDRYINHLSEHMEVITTPPGRYVCISFIYSIDTYFTQFEKLYAYIETNNLKVESDVYEYFMPTNYSPNRTEEFIVEQKIKIKE